MAKDSRGCSLSIDIGGIIAGILSYKSWGLTWWLLLHIPLGWLYVIYWVIFVK